MTLMVLLVLLVLLCRVQASSLRAASLRSWLPFAGVLALSMSSVGCNESAPTDQPFRLELSAVADDGTPLSQVRFHSGDRKLGATTETGRVVVKLRGQEGTTLPIEAHCPDDYSSPEPESLRLARVKSVRGGETSPVRFEAVCRRQTRDVVLVVRAEGGADLPVTIDGQVRGTTDESGNAHVVLSVQQEEEDVAVSLDTSDDQSLRPQNPRRVFELSGRDTIALFHQSFSQAQPKRRATPKRAPSKRRHVPYRMH